MRIPVIQGVIDRRILVNYHVKPALIARWLPPPFRPKLVRGHAIAGICLIRLKNIRPSRIPIPGGIRSENAAHRIAVEWDESGELHSGVFIPRRDTDSRLNVWIGGRFFPGTHHHAKFEVRETKDSMSVSLVSDDGDVSVAVAGRLSDRLPNRSVFGSLDEASDFFASGAVGYSATRNPHRFEGLELRCHEWSVTPLDVDHAASSFFDDQSVFPAGSAEFDCALVMRGIAHEWRSLDDLDCPDVRATYASTGSTYSSTAK